MLPYKIHTLNYTHINKVHLLTSLFVLILLFHLGSLSSTQNVTCIQDFMHTLTLIIGARKNKLTLSQQNKTRRREKQGGSDNSGRSERLKGQAWGS